MNGSDIFWGLFVSFAFLFGGMSLAALLRKMPSKPPRAEEAPPPPLDPYDEGVLAAQDGRGCWANPYAVSTASPSKFHRWYAGWCYGRQVIGGAK